MPLKKFITDCFYLTLFGVVLSACLPDALEVDNVPRPQPTVVVGSQNVPGEFMVVSVSRNINALEGGPHTDIDSLVQSILIDSLQLAIEVNGQNYDLDSIQPGVYTGTNIPEQEGAVYTLNFENPFNKKPVTASAELLPFVGFDSLSTRLEETPFDTLIYINMRIADPPGPNWYMVNVQRLTDEFDIQRRPFTELLDDSEFDGEVHNHNFRVFFQDYAPGDSVLVSMANISEEYHEFLRLRNEQRYNLLEELLEPINYPSNVNNGLGFFHAHIPDVRIFIVE